MIEDTWLHCCAKLVSNQSQSKLKTYLKFPSKWQIVNMSIFQCQYVLCQYFLNMFKISKYEIFLILNNAKTVIYVFIDSQPNINQITKKIWIYELLNINTHHNNIYLFLLALTNKFMYCKIPNIYYSSNRNIIK